MSTQKGGIATMPPLTPTISILSSPKSNWHCPLEQQYFFLQYSKPCPWWTSNNFTLTSALPYPLTPLHPFTSSPRNLTHDGPWTPMVFSEEIIISMCQTLKISNFKSSIINTIIQLLDTLDKTKLSTWSGTSILGQDYVTSLRIFVSPVLVAIVLRLLTIDPMEVSNNFWSWRSHGTPFQWTS